MNRVSIKPLLHFVLFKYAQSIYMTIDLPPLGEGTKAIPLIVLITVKFLLGK